MRRLNNVLAYLRGVLEAAPDPRQAVDLLMDEVAAAGVPAVALADLALPSRGGVVRRRDHRLDW